MSPREELRHVVARLGKQQQDALARFIRDLGPARGDRTQLIEVLAQLDDDRIGKVLDIARAMAKPIEETVNPKSRLVTVPFAAEFRAKLLAHHATHTTKLDRLGFENAFLSASRAAGRQTEEAPSKTTRFWDVRVSGKQAALKSEGAASMKPDQLHISKLSEAAWIQDMRSARMRHDRMMDLMKDFLAAVVKMYVLRISGPSTKPSYELVEIPISHFKLITSLPVSAFDSDAPRIPIADSKGDIMELRLDRSDAKITIGKLRKARCIVHGTWTLDLA